MIWLLLACAEPPEAPVTPEGHDWATEGALVVAGLNEAEALWKQNQREAAASLAAQVYTERWEPRLERAAMKLDPAEARKTEYAFGQLLVEMERKAGRDKVSERIRLLDERVEAVAKQAEAAFPEGSSVPVPVAPAAVSKPIVPSVAPAWEGG